nr:hypothetical protein [Tanacetum cinerariifolium]
MAASRCEVWPQSYKIHKASALGVTHIMAASRCEVWPQSYEIHKASALGVTVMDPNSSLGKICLGEDVVVILSDKVKKSGDWNSPEFQDIANSRKEERNEGVKENMISIEYAVKLCLKHEVKKGNQVVKKELIVALRCEIYFVKFIINPEEDDVEPGSNDDWDHLLNFNIDDVPLLGEEGLTSFICKMGKSSCYKKRAMENLNFFYQDIGTSSSAGGHLTQEEAAKEAIVIRMSRKFALLEEEGPIIETMAYHDKYKKILKEIWKDKVECNAPLHKEDVIGAEGTGQFLAPLPG